MDLLFLKHLHPLTTIMPDHSHVTELLEEMHRKTQDLSFLIDQAHALTIRMKLATNWTTRLYQNGAEPVNFTMEQSSRIDHLLGCIESREMVTQCAIMPAIAAVFTVKEHMFLRIIIYLFQFLLCLIQVTLALAYCCLWNRLK